MLEGMTLVVNLFSQGLLQGMKVGMGLPEWRPWIRSVVPGAFGKEPAVRAQSGLLGTNLSNMAVVVLLLNLNW